MDPISHATHQIKNVISKMHYQQTKDDKNRTAKVTKPRNTLNSIATKSGIIFGQLGSDVYLFQHGSKDIIVKERTDISNLLCERLITKEKIKQLRSVKATLARKTFAH